MFYLSTKFASLSIVGFSVFPFQLFHSQALGEPGSAAKRGAGLLGTYLPTG